MRLSNCPTCGHRPAGTVELVPSVALVELTDPVDGRPQYRFAGETEVIWDGQNAQVDAHGRTLLWCSGCEAKYPNKLESQAPAWVVALVKRVTEIAARHGIALHRGAM